MPSSLDISDVLGSLALYSAFFAAVTQLLDWLLSDKAKAAVSSSLTHVWYWIANQRLGRLLEALQSSRIIKFVLMAFFLIALANTAITVVDAYGEPIFVPEAVIWIYGVTPGVAVSLGVLAFASYLRLNRLIQWLTAKQTPLSTLLRVAILFAIAAAPVIIAGAIIWAFSDSWDPLPFVVSVSILAALFLPLALIAALACLMLTWLLFLMVLKAGLAAAEFLIRKLVEYPRGPVLAANILLAAAGGILKNLPQ